MKDFVTQGMVSIVIKKMINSCKAVVQAGEVSVIPQRGVHLFPNVFQSLLVNLSGNIETLVRRMSPLPAGRDLSDPISKAKLESPREMTVPSISGYKILNMEEKNWAWPLLGA